MSHRIVSRYQRPVAFLVIWLQVLSSIMFSFAPLFQARAAEKTAIEQSASTLQALSQHGLIGSGSAPVPAPAASVAATPAAPAIPPSDMNLPELSSSSPFSAQGVSPSAQTASDPLEQTASAAMRLQGVLGADNSTAYAVSEMKGVATGLANQALQDWLNQVGHARTQMTFGQGGQIGGDVDLLVPLLDLDTTLLFSQTGLRRHDDRSTLNLGLGVRQFTDSNWMLGANTFFDYDLTGKNRRLGVGTEAWTDNLKLSANLYHGLTDWHQSPLQEDYDERPANGYDVRAEAYLPAYPQIGGKVMYEAYRGDNVALASFEDRSKNPTALTLGLNYTPVPLVTLGVDHKNGSGGVSDTQVSLGMNYRFGVPWAAQTDPEAVGILRSLVGSRYDFVARNNTIVLDYRKQDLIRLTLPETATAAAGEQLTLTASVQAKYGLEHIVWTAPELVSAGGQLQVTGKDTLMVTLPAFTPEQLRAVNGFMLTAVAYDPRGNASNEDMTLLTVTRSLNDISEFKVLEDKDYAAADGVTEDVVRLTVKNSQTQQPVAGIEVTFEANNGATLKTLTATTDAQGQATAALTNLKAGTSVVTATLSNGNSAKTDTHFVADPDTATILAENFSVTTGALAGGQETNALSATVTDASGNVQGAGIDVTFAVTEGAATPAIQTVQTDESGVAKATLVSLVAADNLVTASVTTPAGTMTAGPKNSAFVLDKVDASKSTVVANPTSIPVTETSALTFTAKNTTNGPIIGLTVTTAPLTGNGATGSSVGVWTDNGDGTYGATLTAGPTAGPVVITPLVAGSAAVATPATVTLTADASTSVVTALTSAPDLEQVADGVKVITFTATLTDANNNPVPNTAVMFTPSVGDAVLGTPTVTDTNGQATVTLKDGTVEAVTVTAKSAVNAADLGKQKTVNFVADTTTATIVDADFTVNSGAKADGQETNALTATVKDANGNLVPNIDVTFIVT
ncbi:inverse autotransporter beta domain-containing protein, partial [Serratia sp. T13T92]|uniref:inverse autotransporter beta domain-containing protein n=1 Tax=Serratia sp. T13T92 TaxID=3397496 RepID=UPI0039E0BA02